MPSSERRDRKGYNVNEWLKLVQEFGVPLVVAAAAVFGIVWLVRRALDDSRAREATLTKVIVNHQEHQLQVGSLHVEAMTRVNSELRSLHSEQKARRDEHGKQFEALTKLLERSQ